MNRHTHKTVSVSRVMEQWRGGALFTRTGRKALLTHFLPGIWDYARGRVLSLHTVDILGCNSILVGGWVDGALFYALYNV